MLLMEGEEVEKEIDKGFGDMEDCTQETLQQECQFQEDLGTFSLPTEKTKMKLMNR